MNTDENMIIAKGKIVTSELLSCRYNASRKFYELSFKNGKTFSYLPENVEWLKEPVGVTLDGYVASIDGALLVDLRSILLFKSKTGEKYYHLRYNSGRTQDVRSGRLKFEPILEQDSDNTSVFNCLKEIASSVSIRLESGVNILAKQYSRIKCISKETALACYLGESEVRGVNLSKSAKNSSNIYTEPIIFPFGANRSQQKAVERALENQLSVIEGPPGTGKTQTILNIIANLIIRGKTIEVVSNNNSATANIMEKLEKYDLGFLAASLGRAENKEQFLANQSGGYPEISIGDDASYEMDELAEKILKLNRRNLESYKLQEQKAELQQSLRELDAEAAYFKKYVENGDIALVYRDRSKSQDILNILIELEQSGNLNLWRRLLARFAYGLGKWSDFARIRSGKITNPATKNLEKLRHTYYLLRRREVKADIAAIDTQLKDLRADRLNEELKAYSLRYLWIYLGQRYGNREKRTIYGSMDLFKARQFNQDYPLVLSTTYSARSSLNPNYIFDYLIMDESSQVDIVTGALALSGARNAVIVGDTRQLPNIIDNEGRRRVESIMKRYDLRDCYNFCDHSFLASLRLAIPEIKTTLLREHYRCNPRIINFCNQKFYNGELIVMTKDDGKEAPLLVMRTSVGNHERNRFNQRQIDVVKIELLPQLKGLDVGIIAPYNNQVNHLRSELSATGADIATVHKFQGREKDVIIMTTVDDQLSDFVDDPYLLNVAVSRAKKKFCLVVSGNQQSEDRNISDLIHYIEYNNCEVQDSKLHSVFDYLYAQYAEQRKAFLEKRGRISEYDSENLAYALIEDELAASFPQLGVVVHQPLRDLIRQKEVLSEAEQNYALNSWTHLDFLIYNKITKRPVLAIEVDGYSFHKEGTRQSQRDLKKDSVLKKIDLPLLRLSTTGSRERSKIRQALKSALTSS